MAFCQTDPRWANQIFNGGPDTFGRVACYVTCFANLRTFAGHETTPPQMEAILAAQGVLQDELIQRDSALAEALPAEWTYVGTYHCESFPADPAQTDVSDPDVYRILHQKNGTIPSHFVNIVQGGDPPMIFDVASCARIAAGQGLVKGDWKVTAQKIVTYRHSGGPVPPPLNTFTGSVSASGGAHVRILPGTDKPIVPQPGANPDVVDHGIPITFDGWCHHPPPISDALSGQPDDRWFRVQWSHHWIASAVILGNPPADMAPIPDPA